MSFMDILEKTLKEEGGWVNDADDAGGATMMGVTQATLSVYRGYQVSEEEVAALSRDEAIAVYRKMFYRDPKIDLLPEGLQGPVFDWGVNSGPGRAVMGLQQVVDNADVVPDINIDGGIGPMTLNAVTKTLAGIGLKKFVNMLQDERQKFCDEIVRRKPSQAKYIVGWTNRINRFRIK